MGEIETTHPPSPVPDSEQGSSQVRNMVEPLPRPNDPNHIHQHHRRSRVLDRDRDERKEDDPDRGLGVGHGSKKEDGVDGSRCAERGDCVVLAGEVGKRGRVKDGGLGGDGSEETRELIQVEEGV